MYLKQGNTTIYYKKEGNQENTILILPGWGETRKTFLPIITHLKGKYTVYSLDYPNFGNSPTLTEEWTIYDYAKIVKHLLEKEKIKDPIIIAHSFGGRIASVLQGYYHISIPKMVLIDVAGIRRKNIVQYGKGILYKALKKILLLLHQDEKVKKLQQKFSSQDYQNLPNEMKKTFQNIIKEDLRKYYKRIQSETLIIWGEKDTATPLKDAYLLNKIIKDSGLIIYKKATHFSYIDYSYNTIKILLEFLKKEDID